MSIFKTQFIVWGAKKGGNNYVKSEGEKQSKRQTPQDEKCSDINIGEKNVLL